MKLRFDVYTRDVEAAVNGFRKLSVHCKDSITLTRNKHWTDTEKYYYNLFGAIAVDNVGTLTAIMSDDFVDDTDDLVFCKLSL
tara:strand:+ start:546 stop:794 length:249 start_codon:yes stop_codon:yes gene_type:complete